MSPGRQDEGGVFNANSGCPVVAPGRLGPSLTLTLTLTLTFTLGWSWADNWELVSDPPRPTRTGGNTRVCLGARGAAEDFASFTAEAHMSDMVRRRTWRRKNEPAQTRPRAGVLMTPTDRVFLLFEMWPVESFSRRE